MATLADRMFGELRPMPHAEQVGMAPGGYVLEVTTHADAVAVNDADHADALTSQGVRGMLKPGAPVFVFGVVVGLFLVLNASAR